MASMSVERLASAFESETRTIRLKARAFTAANWTHDTLSRQLARFVVKTRFDDLPKPIVEAWKTIVLDALAVGFVGSKDRLARAMSDVAHKLGGMAECTAMNSTYRMDVGRTAWLNGTLIGKQGNTCQQAERFVPSSSKVGNAPNKRRGIASACSVKFE